MSLVYRSAVASLLVQLLVTAITSAGFAVPLPEKDAPDLRLIFALELGSQVIEFLYYLIVVCRYRSIATWTRYLDWVLSTPIMLLSTALFFRHRAGAELFPATFADPMLWVCVALNELMLVFGFAM